MRGFVVFVGLEKRPMEYEKTSRARWWRWWPLLLVFVLSSFRWMLEARVPAANTTVLTEALGCGFASLLALAEALRGRKLRPSDGAMLQCGVAGALIVGGPLVGLLAGGRGLEVGGLAMALALVPIVIAVAASAFGHIETSSLPGRLWPGIAAVTGLLLLLPEPSLADARNDLLLVFAPVMTGVGAAWIRARDGDIAWRCAAALMGAAVVFGIAAIAHGSGTVHVAAVGVDALMAGLVVLALLRVGAVRWSGQFALVPLAVILESLIYVPFLFSGRLLAGMGLLLVATVFLLLPPKPEDPPELDLL